MRPVIETLENKGFNGADIHFFLMQFGIGSTVIFDPPMFARSSEFWENQRKIELEKSKRMWEEATIAANFEIPR